MKKILRALREWVFDEKPCKVWVFGAAGIKSWRFKGRRKARAWAKKIERSFPDLAAEVEVMRYEQAG